MNGIVFTSQTDATAFSAAIDARLGYPKDGTPSGGGRHAAPATGRTIKHSDVVKHPTLNLWRYPHDERVQGEIVRGLALPVTASVLALGPDWFP